MVEEKKEWQTEDPNVFSIGGYRIAIAKKGRDQAVQIESLNKWLKEYVAPIIESLRGTADQTQLGLQLLIGSMTELTVEAQFSLARTLIGTKDTGGNALPEDLLEVYYDIEWVLAALDIASRNASAQKLMTSFFTNMT